MKTDHNAGNNKSLKETKTRQSPIVTLVEYESPIVELTASHAEIQTLRTECIELQESISNEEIHVKSLHAQGNNMLCEICELKLENEKLKRELDMQHEYNTKENAELQQEISVFKSKLRERNELVQEIIKENEELISKKEDIKERYDVVSIKYMKLKKTLINQ